MDEIKDKIILAVKEAIANNAEAVDCDYDIIEIDCDDVDHIAEQVADALIAAGIGDVGETKEKLKKINERILLGDIIACDLSAKCAEYKYRAEVAEKMFNILYEETSEYMKVLSKEWYKYQAEKELAELKGGKE